MADHLLADDIGAVAALDDPVRRRLYFMVSERGDDVGRDEAAEAHRYIESRQAVGRVLLIP